MRAVSLSFTSVQRELANDRIAAASCHPSRRRMRSSAAGTGQYICLTRGGTLLPAGVGHRNFVGIWTPSSVLFPSHLLTVSSSVVEQSCSVQHTHTHTHARTHARTHAHTHTHTLSLSLSLCRTRCSTHTYHSRRQKFCCRRTARVEQFTGYYKTDHQLRTV